MRDSVRYYTSFQKQFDKLEPNTVVDDLQANRPSLQQSFSMCKNDRLFSDKAHKLTCNAIILGP